MFPYKIKQPHKIQKATHKMRLHYKIKLPHKRRLCFKMRLLVNYKLTKKILHPKTASQWLADLHDTAYSLTQISVLIGWG